MTIWHDFLLSLSAHTDAAGVHSFTKTSPSFLLYRPYVTELCQFSTFFLSGSDVSTFLQGQLTTDCQRLSPSQASPTALCNAKGRVITTGIIEKTSEGFFLTVPRSMTKRLQAHLQKYILFSKVNLTLMDDAIRIEAGGDGVQTQLSGFLGSPVNDKPYEVTESKGIRLIALPGVTPRWMIRSTDPKSMIKLWQSLSEVASPIGYPEAEHINLNSHVIHIDDSLSELFLPQMIDYDLIGGMSLKKGCYAGQEVLARASHRGVIKRNLYRATCSESHRLTKGMPILMAETNASVGILVANSKREGYHDILAVLSTPSLSENCQLTVDGAAIQELSRAKPSIRNSDPA